MATVRASCPDCGPVELHHAQVSVIKVGAEHKHRFRCPRCWFIVLNRCEGTTAEMLVGAGCDVVVITFAPETRPAILTPIDDDVLIVMHELFIAPDDGGAALMAAFRATEGLV